MGRCCWSVVCGLEAYLGAMVEMVSGGVVLLGLGLVGWGWLVVGCAGRFGVGGLELVSGRLCWFELVGRGLCCRD